MPEFQEIVRAHYSTGKRGVDVATAYQGITVYTAIFAHRVRPVFYAALPGYGETGNGCKANRAADQNRLAALLWDHVAAMENPHWQCRLLGDRAALPIRVAHGPLGRPHLLRGEVRGPAISFSEGGGNVWAALCGDASDIGIDVASAEEFQGGYPLHRVFHDQELRHTLRLTRGDLTKALALLWSIKEAVVKALGCAFHLVAPRQVHISPSVGGGRGYEFPVSLSGKALARYPLCAGGSIRVRSFPREGVWLSIALLNEPTLYGDGGIIQTNVQQRHNVDS